MRTRLLRFRACAVPILAALVVGLAPLSAMPVRAQQGYPSRPVQLVVAFEPGGSGDLVAGLLAQGLPSALGQPVAVEHRPGASGAVGTRSVARAVPDGHTLLIGQLTEIAVDPILNKDVGYDPERDLQPVALAAIIPRALVVQNTAPYAAPVRAGTWRPNCSASGPRAGSSTFLSKALVRR